MCYAYDLPMPKVPRDNSCGHPERRHKGHGKCSPCYQAWARTNSPEVARARDARAYYARQHDQVEYSRRRRQRLKAEMVAAYGGRCACCGESEIAFLSLDHINGGGAAHRKEMGGSLEVWMDVRSRGYPKEEYRVLCMNCQFGCRRADGCPHQRSKS